MMFEPIVAMTIKYESTESSIWLYLVRDSNTDSRTAYIDLPAQSYFRSIINLTLLLHPLFPSN